MVLYAGLRGLRGIQGGILKGMTHGKFLGYHNFLGTQKFLGFQEFPGTHQFPGCQEFPGNQQFPGSQGFLTKAYILEGNRGKGVSLLLSTMQGTSDGLTLSGYL